MERSAIVATLQAALSDVPGLAAAYLFGSTAAGDAGPDSDVDVGLLYVEAPALTLVDQPFDLADDLARRLGRAVDVVVLNTAPADLRIRVLREGLLLRQADPAARIRFVVATRNEYFDLEPILREYRRARRTA